MFKVKFYMSFGENLIFFPVVIELFLDLLRFDKVLAKLWQQISKVQFYLGHSICSTWQN